MKLSPLTIFSGLFLLSLSSRAGTIPVPDEVSFFFRASPGTEELVFSTMKGNRILSAKTRKTQVLPGEIDPALSPDGRLLAVPETWIYDPGKKKLLSEREAARLGYRDNPKKRVRFTLVAGAAWEWTDPAKGEKRKTEHTESSLRAAGLAYSAQYMSFYGRKGAAWSLLLQDQEVQVEYQSLGQLKEKTSTGATTYRLLVQGDAGLFSRDYRLDAKRGQLESSGPVRQICAGYAGTLPMLAKNAEELVSFDAPLGVTKVMRIGENGELCELADTLPYHAGKADFSPNGARLAFHLFDKESARLRGYVYERANKKLTELPSPPREDAYFPTFLSDQKIALLCARRVGEKRKFMVHLLAVPPLAEKNGKKK